MYATPASDSLSFRKRTFKEIRYPMHGAVGELLTTHPLLTKINFTSASDQTASFMQRVSTMLL